MDEQKSIANILKIYDIKGVILDFDGTIVDLAVNWNALKEKLSRKFNLPAKRNSINDLLTIIREKHGRVFFKKALTLVEQYELKQKEHATIHKDMIELVSLCVRKNITIAIFSNNTKLTINFFLKKLGVQNFFDVVIAKDDVEFYKPSLDGLQRILTKWQINPNQVLLIDNDRNVLNSAGKIGLKTYSA